MELVGVVEGIIFRNEENGFTVLELDADGVLETAVGVMPLASEGEKIRLTGSWVAHKDYGRQFKAEQYVVYAPTSLENIEKYLASGVIKGIGPATAGQIVEAFGERSLEIMQFAPERLLEIKGIGKSKLDTIVTSFQEQRSMQDILLALQGYGITTNQAVKIYKIYGDASATRIAENPYCLVEDVVGIGFKTADNIAIHMGVEYSSPFRVSSGLKYLLQWALGEGHTYLPREKLLELAEKMLGVEAQTISEILDQLVLSGQLISQPYPEHEAVYLPRAYGAEMDVANGLLQGRFTQPADTSLLKKLEQEEGIELTEEQRAAICMALDEGICVITGGPGTGKTTIIKFIAALFSRMHLSVELCAPTGRAAKRMTEATGNEAQTIHRLLEYGYAESFGRDADNPLQCDAVIVDEVSMVDIFLMRRLLLALPQGARLVLVGDADQLPSVGPGNVLREIVQDGGIPACRLKKVHRQGINSGIIVNAHRINDGEYPVLTGYDDFVFVERQEAQRALSLVLKAYRQGFMGFEPLVDIQVLSPMKKGVLGVINLNRQLQAAVNPPAPGKAEKAHGETIFRVGDKVIQTKNNYKQEWTRGTGYARQKGEGVFNGDLGSIMAIDAERKTLSVLFDDERQAEYEFAQLDELDLAYCLSVHKSQGSEFPAVLMPLVGGPPMLMTRNLLYTGMTRAKTAAILIGRESTVRAMVDNNFVVQRYSGLLQCMEKVKRMLGSLYGTD